MEHIGLMPSDTGRPGGKRTGQKMGHYIIDGGLFYKAFQMLDPDELEELRLKYLPVASLTANRKRDKGTEARENLENETGKKGKSGKRTKYRCRCGNNIWGKSGLFIRCLDCDEDYEEVENS